MFHLHKHSPRIRPATAILIISVLLVLSQIAHGEVRTYVTLSTRLLNPGNAGSDRRVDVFIREESRYRQSGLALSKSSAGVTPMFASWLKVNIYYANKDIRTASHLNKHLLAGEAFLSMQHGNLLILTIRQGNEWHITDGFYRYRNLLELAIRTPLKRIRAKFSEEWRFDSDQSRVNMIEGRLGLDLKMRAGLSGSVFLDIESNRRGRVDWKDTTYLGFSMAERL